MTSDPARPLDPAPAPGAPLDVPAMLARNWQQVAGALVMAAGALAAAFFLGLAIFVTANYVEWDNAADALGTTAVLTLPPATGGLAIVALGRWLYGFGRGARPLTVGAAAVLPIVGMLAAFGYGGMLLRILLGDPGNEDGPALIHLGLAALAAVAATWAGLELLRRWRP
ncbi:MAG: hypothetical protein R3C52_07105 [Hyphomonadaceae bacterium]